jgi:hypothetical protein
MSMSLRGSYEHCRRLAGISGIRAGPVNLPWPGLGAGGLLASFRTGAGNGRAGSGGLGAACWPPVLQLPSLSGRCPVRTLTGLQQP